MIKAVGKVFTLLLTIGLLLSITAPVFADDSTGTADFGNFFDSEGNLLEGVTDGGEVEIEADWMIGDLGGEGTGFASTATYHVYVAPNGDSLLAPSYTTMLSMIGAGEESGLTSASGTYQTFLATVATFFSTGTASPVPSTTWGGTDSAFIYDDAEHQGTIDLLQRQLQAANFGYYSEGSTGFIKEFVFTWNFLTNLLGVGNDDNMLAMTYLYYTKENCDKSPIGCQESTLADNIADPGTYNSPSCPASTIVPGVPYLSIEKTGPASPLVVGQDPDKRGADVSFSVTVPPTVYTYYIPIPIYGEVEVCTNNCSGTGTPEYGTATVLIRIDCEKHVEVYAEPIVATSASANLTQDSINWIRGNLSQYYYGATTQQTSFNLVPGLTSASAFCDGGNTCHANALIERIQFKDPGTFNLSLTATTAGTPVTTGRTLRTAGSLQVSFISVRLIENGSR